MNGRFLRGFTIIAIACLLTACAGSEPWRASEAALAGDPIAMWQDGQEAVSQGEAQVRRGEERIQEGLRIIHEGEAIVSQGNDLVTVSRDNYRMATEVAGSALTPEQLRSEADRLRDFARVWEDGMGQIDRVNKRISDGNDRVAEGQSIVLQGRTLIETGQSLMRNSEQIRREQAEAEATEEANRDAASQPGITRQPDSPATSTQR